MISYTDLTTTVQPLLLTTDSPTEIVRLHWRNDTYLDHSVTITLYPQIDPDKDPPPRLEVIYETPLEERTVRHGVKQKDCQNLAKEIKVFFNSEVKPYQ
jgi:hypothetical protein